MRQGIQISIPSPCHESWAAMTLAEKGRFCASCQKVVHDFTAMTDNEIALFTANNRNGCGMFLSSQLDRDLLLTRKKKPFWSSISAVMVGILAFAGTTAFAQEPPATEQCAAAKTGNTKTFPNNQGTVKGTVFDGARKPLAGARVKVKGTGTETVTDENGDYTIKAVTGDVLLFSARKVKPSEEIVEEGVLEYYTTLYYKRDSKNVYRTLGRYF